MATKIEVKNFIEKIAPFAQVEYQKGKKILPSVCIAQACCESSYGTTEKMKNANAMLGVKVGKNKVHFGSAWHDKAYDTMTKECYDGKTYENIHDFFRAYDTLQDCITDYYDILCSCSRYKGAVDEKDCLKAIKAIKAGGYATSPTYIQTVTSIIRTNNLTRYDICRGNKTFNPCSYNGNSIVMALNSIGISSTKEFRTKIARANGFIDYNGMESQNETLLHLLKNGELLRP